MPDNRTRPLSSYYTHPKLPSHLDKIPIVKVWQEYQATRSVQSRNHLVLNYFGLVEKQAYRMARRLPYKIDVEDLMSEGVFGLMEAIDTFDHEAGADFKDYAASRIRGTIIEGLRKMDWTPRLVRRRESKVKPIIRKIKLKTGRPAEEEEIAEGLGITIEEFLKKSQFGNSISSDSRPARLIPLLYERRYHKSEADKYENMEPESYARESQPDKMLLLEELRSAVRNLPEQEKAIMLLRYNNGITMEEIGETLGVSQPRISQTHKRMLEKLERKCA